MILNCIILGIGIVLLALSLKKKDVLYFLIGLLAAIASWDRHFYSESRTAIYLGIAFIIILSKMEYNVYTFVISLRYIKKRMITWFSILGIALGVMVLIVVLSVMDGFRKEFISRLQGILSDIIINVRVAESNYDSIEKKILDTPHVKSCAPHLRGIVLIGTSQYYVGGLVLGIDEQKEFQVSKLQEYLVTPYKEIRLGVEQLLENNILYPDIIEISWKILGGEYVQAEANFPAGMRIVCQKIFTFINKQKSSTEQTKYQHIAYTFNAKKQVVCKERNLSYDAINNIPKLSDAEEKEWNSVFSGMSSSLNSRKLEEYMSYFSPDLRFGSSSLSPENPFHFQPLDPNELMADIRPVLLGYELMKQLELRRGDEITLMTGKRDPKEDKLKAVSRKFVVVGGFRSGWQEIDAHLVYTRRQDLVGFLDISSDVNEISVNLDDYKNSDIAKDLLDKKLNDKEMYLLRGKPYVVQKWEELRRSLLSAIRLERMVMTIIVSLIVLLAVVSIMIILILLVTEKTKDIGILKAMGASDQGIMAIFLCNGVFISFFGSLMGSGLGVWFSLKINTIADFIFQYTGFRLFPKDVYYLDRIPCSFSMENVATISISTLVLTLIFCAIPALKAAKMDPVEALNSESPSIRLWRKKKTSTSNAFSPARNTFYGVENVAKDYVMGSYKLRVFENISLDVKRGEILVILGSSGVGKSTLLHLMGLIDTPDQGTVYYEGINLNSYTSKQQAKVRNQEIGFIFQFYHLLPEFTALENVLLGAMIRYNLWEWNYKKKEMIQEASALLEKVGLKDRMKHRPVELSGGERQRVAIARALMMKPRVVLCDEPTGNLDEKNSLAMQELIWQLNRELNQTFVIVTHEERIARKGNRVFRMEHGKLNKVEF